MTSIYKEHVVNAENGTVINVNMGSILALLGVLDADRSFDEVNDDDPIKIYLTNGKYLILDPYI
jgi:hypothetical protein